MKQRYYIIMIGLVTVLLHACSDELSVNVQQRGEIITFSASKQHIITRSGSQIETFTTGTKYHILECNTNGQTSSNYTGTEKEDHTIQIDANPLPTFPVQGALDFYAVTYGNNTEVPPTIDKDSKTVTADDSKDLMFSNNLKAQTAANGVLQMNFKHALSMLTFEIVKQAPEAGKVNLPSNLTVTSITIQKTPKQGTFNVETGEWYIDPETTDKTVFDGSQAVTEGATSIGNETLVMPNQETVNIQITLEGNGLDDKKKTISYSLYDGTGTGTDPFLFQPNHKYKLTIMVLNNDVRIVTIIPQVYEWIDIDMNQKDILEQNTDIYLGQPVTFGNLMWMDRNLGAKTADCENDFYNSIGYYYQFGRNIPYILDVEKWKTYVNDKDEKDIIAENGATTNGPHIMAKGYAQFGSLAYYTQEEQNAMTQEEKEFIAQCQYECMYTYDHQGKKVYGYSTTRHTADKIIRTPGETIANDDSEYNTTRKYYQFVGGSINNWTSTPDLNANFWKNTSNQPCPQGWRLPTKSDLYSFMPLKQINWNTYSYPRSYSHPGDANGGAEEGIFGKVQGINGTYNVIYLLKNKGTENAYRIRIISNFCKTNEGTGYSKNKRYVMISRYPASKTDQINDFKEEDWNNPVETAYFPGAGFLITDGMPDLRTFGRGSVLRTSEPSSGNNWVLYLSVTDYQVSVQGASRRSLGDQIRCVRDINLKE